MDGAFFLPHFCHDERERVFLDETTWSVLVLESLSCERRDFYDERAPLESTAALSRAGVGAQR